MHNTRTHIHSTASYLDAGDTGMPVDWAHIKCLSAAKIRIYEKKIADSVKISFWLWNENVHACYT